MAKFVTYCLSGELDNVLTGNVGKFWPCFDTYPIVKKWYRYTTWMRYDIIYNIKTLAYLLIFFYPLHEISSYFCLPLLMSSDLSISLFVLKICNSLPGLMGLHICKWSLGYCPLCNMSFSLLRVSVCETCQLSVAQ